MKHCQPALKRSDGRVLLLVPTGRYCDDDDVTVDTVRRNTDKELRGGKPPEEKGLRGREKTNTRGEEVLHRSAVAHYKCSSKQDKARQVCLADTNEPTPAPVVSGGATSKSEPTSTPQNGL